MNTKAVNLIIAEAKLTNSSGYLKNMFRSDSGVLIGILFE